MKCNELMVGDWIADDRGFPVQVVCYANGYQIWNPNRESVGW